MKAFILISQTGIDIFTVNSGHTGHIFGVFHPALYFKRSDPRFDELRQQLKRTNILGA